jgi:membrane carboxypeptidase/penicillin-binding protein PbpC
MDPQIARQLNNVLSDNDARAYVFGRSNALTLPDRPVAAKTGTTNNFHDAWTVGYTPSLVTVVWVGNNNNAEMKRGADGSVIAAPIWQAYMKRATKGMPVERFTTPTPTATTKPALLGKVAEQKIKVDRVSGLRATEYTPADLVEERTFYEAHSILYYVDKDDPTGPPLANPTQDPQYVNWETAVQAWVQKSQWHTTNTAPILFDDIHVPGNQPQVTMLNPTTNQTLSNRALTISATVNAPRPIMRLEVLMNNQPIGSTSGAPTSFPIRIPNTIDKGFHDLTVMAVDDVGNRGQATVVVNLTADRDTQGGVFLTAPPNETVWSRATFPKTASLTLVDPLLYRRVDASFVGGDGIRRLISSEILPTQPSITFSIPAGPPVGRYALTIEAFYKEGDAKDLAQTFITVTE